MATQLQEQPKQQPTALSTLRDMLERSKEKFAEVAPKHLKPERLIRLLLAGVGRNPKLLECTPESVLQFAMKCSETGLEPIGPGGAWPIPYGKVLTFVPDYRGLVNCAKRAGCIIDATAEVVYEGDHFDYELGLSPSLEHKPTRGERGQLQATYCIYVLPDGERRFVVMHRADVEHIKRKSRAAGSGPWVTDESEMWKKTVIRRAMKPFAGMSRELDLALQSEAEPEPDREPVPMPRALGEVEPVPAPEQPPEDPITPETSLLIEERLNDLPQAKVKETLKTLGVKKASELNESQARKFLEMTA